MGYLIEGGVDERFAAAMAKMAETLGARLTEGRVRMYANLLGDIPWRELQMAFRRATLERRSEHYGNLPLPGDIRACVAPSSDDAAVLAWAALSRAVEAGGMYASVECEDAVAADALRVVFGTWPAFCELDEGPTLAQRRQEFLAAYRQALRRVTPGSAADRLAGMCEQSGQYPDDERMSRVWLVRIAATGEVTVQRERPALPGGTGHDGHERAAICEGDIAETSEDTTEGRGTAGGGDGARDGGAP